MSEVGSKQRPGWALDEKPRLFGRDGLCQVEGLTGVRPVQGGHGAPVALCLHPVPRAAGRPARNFPRISSGFPAEKQQGRGGGIKRGFQITFPVRGMLAKLGWG